MKKVLLLGLFLPLLSMAQSGVNETNNRRTAETKVSTIGIKEFPRAQTFVVPQSMNKWNADSIHTETIFSTYFDYQAAVSVSRKSTLHTGGKISATCNFSNSSSSPWSDRGSAFNYYDGNSAAFDGSKYTSKRLESKRCGYPCITSFMEGGVEKDLVISHFASTSNKDSSGGLFMSMNDAIGSTNFTETRVDFPYGILWPRAAASGDYIHIIGNYFVNDSLPLDTVKRKGVRQPTVYYRYRISTHSFDVKGVVLPGYDNSRYAQGSGDSYSLDVKDSIVAIVIGGQFQDLAMWKSTDNGNNWSKTMIDSFGRAPFDMTKDLDTFSKWVRGNDGSSSIIIDKNNKVHVFWAVEYFANTKQADKRYSWLFRTDLIGHWDEVNTQKVVVGFTPGNDSATPIPANNFTDAGALYGRNSQSTYPSATIDDSGYIYLIWSSPYRGDGTVSFGATFYRHIFYTYTKDGKNWAKVDSIKSDLSIEALGNLINTDPNEDVYASFSRDADNFVHMTWQRDPTPGTTIGNSQGGAQNQIMYAQIPTAMLKYKTFPVNSGIEQTKTTNFSMGVCYPNPSNTSVNIPLNLVKSGMTSIKITDMLGREVFSNTIGELAAGKNKISVDVSNFSKGVYFYTIKIGINSLTNKMIVE